MTLVCGAVCFCWVHQNCVSPGWWPDTNDVTGWLFWLLLMAGVSLQLSLWVLLLLLYVEVQAVALNGQHPELSKSGGQVWRRLQNCIEAQAGCNFSIAYFTHFRVSASTNYNNNSSNTTSTCCDDLLANMLLFASLFHPHLFTLLNPEAREKEKATEMLQWRNNIKWTPTGESKFIHPYANFLVQPVLLLSKLDMWIIATTTTTE